MPSERHPRYGEGYLPVSPYASGVEDTEVKRIVRRTPHNDLAVRDATEAHPAAAIVNTPAGTLTATDVQAAVDELDTKKQADIQWQDEEVNLGDLGGITTISFAGAGVTAAVEGSKLTVTIAGGGGGVQLPVGFVFISVVSTNPFDLLGYGTWESIGAGRVLVGFDVSDEDFDEAEETGGAKEVAAAGSNAAEASHTHGVTTNVAVGNHVVTQPNAHVVTQPSAHVVTQPNAHVVTQPANHTVTQPSNHVVTQPSAHASHTHSVGQAEFGTAYVSQVSEDVEVHKSGGEVSTPTGGPSASLTHSGTAVDAHSGTAVSVHSGTAVDAHSGTAVSAHSGTAVDAHSGTAVDAHSVTNNEVTSGAGSSHTHAFTGAATSVVQPYLVAYFWKRTA